MNEQDIILLAQAARRALAEGMSPADVNRVIRQQSNGAFADVAQLAQAAADTGASLEEIARPKGEPGQDRERFGLRDAAGLIGQGATFGFSDEIAGLLGAVTNREEGEGYGDARRRITGEARQDIGDARRRAGTIPGLALEVAGGIPTGGTAFKVGRQALGRIAPRVPGIARGAAIGAGEGAVAGAGYAEEGERGRGAAIGGLFGAALGGAADAVATGVGRLRSGVRGDADKVGGAVADRLRQHADVTGEAGTVRREASERGRAAFRDLDRMGALDSPELGRALRRPEVAPHMPREVADGTRHPTFKESQKAFQKLRKMREQAYKSGNLDGFERLADAEEGVLRALNAATDGRFSVANQVYGETAEAVRQVTQGQRLVAKSANEFEEAARALADSPEALRAFREGAASRIAHQLESGSAASVLRRLDSRSMQRKLAVIFDGDSAALQAFRESIRDAAVTDRGAIFKELARIFGAGAVGGGVVSQI
jgi:hypothetical protein